MADLDQVFAEIVALRAEVSALKTAQASALRPVLSVAEAMELVGAESRSAFGRWVAKWRVPGDRRYARRALLAGLEREANGATRRRPPAKAKDNPAVTLGAAA